MKMKICTKCGVEKEECKENFLFRNDTLNFRSNCTNCIVEYNKKYRGNNIENVRIYHKNYRKNKRTINPKNKLRDNCSRMINAAMNGQKGNFSFLEYLDYKIDELKFHLENQFDEHMSWENYGSYWHLDHIIPQSKLLYSSMEDENFKICWDINNLRPLDKIKNMSKGNKITEEAKILLKKLTKKYSK